MSGAAETGLLTLIETLSHVAKEGDSAALDRMERAVAQLMELHGKLPPPLPEPVVVEPFRMRCQGNFGHLRARRLAGWARGFGLEAHAEDGVFVVSTYTPIVLDGLLGIAMTTGEITFEEMVFIKAGPDVLAGYRQAERETAA